MLALAWFGRHSILAGAASILVEEDPLRPVEILVPSHSVAEAAALEAALLYEQHISPRIVMTQWVSNPMEEEIRHQGIPYLGTSELNQYILQQRGVPSSAITIIPDQADGTGTEIAAVVDFVKRCHVQSLMMITERSHTARTKWLLRRELPAFVRASVRSPRFDRFVIAGWWREREQSRELVTEYLRWFNTFFLRDWWAHRSSPQLQTASPDCRH